MALSAERRQITIWASLFLMANVGVKAGYAGGILLLATLLVPAEYANYGLLYALQGAATTLGVIGLVEVTAGRLRDHAGAARNDLFRDMNGLFLITAAAAGVLLLPVALWLASRGMGIAVIPAALLGVATGFSILQASFHRIEERHGISLVSSAGVPLAAILGVLAGALVSGNLVVMFSAGLVGAVGVMAGLAVAGNLHGVTMPTARSVRIAAVEIMPFLVIGIFGWASGYGMTLAVDWQFDPVDVAGFTFLLTAASIGQVIASSMNMVWAPRFYQLFNGGQVERAERRSAQFFAATALALGGAGFFAAAAFPWLTHIIGGNLASYGSLRFELMLLLAGYVLTTPFWHAQNFFLVAGRGRELMANTTWSGGISLLVWIGCMIAWGPEGAYIGFLLQMAIKSGFLWVSARRYWPIQPWWIVIAGAAMLPFAAWFVPTP